MLIVELLFLIIPVLIIFRITKTDDKQARKIRRIYAIPSFIILVLFILLEVAEYKYKVSSTLDDVNIIYIISFLLDALCLIVNNAGKTKEKIMIIDKLSEEVQEVRDNEYGNVTINIDTDDIEKL